VGCRNLKRGGGKVKQAACRRPESHGKRNVRRRVKMGINHERRGEKHWGIDEKRYGGKERGGGERAVGGGGILEGPSRPPPTQKGL